MERIKKMNLVENISLIAKMLCFVALVPILVYSFFGLRSLAHGHAAKQAGIIAQQNDQLGQAAAMARQFEGLKTNVNAMIDELVALKDPKVSQIILQHTMQKRTPPPPVTKATPPPPAEKKADEKKAEATPAQKETGSKEATK